MEITENYRGKVPKYSEGPFYWRGQGEMKNADWGRKHCGLYFGAFWDLTRGNGD